MQLRGNSVEINISYIRQLRNCLQYFSIVGVLLRVDGGQAFGEVG